MQEEGVADTTAPGAGVSQAELFVLRKSLQKVTILG